MDVCIYFINIKSLSDFVFGISFAFITKILKRYKKKLEAENG
jgi:hypothetical protein